MKEQSASAWAICSEFAGVLVHTVSRTRQEAIDSFMQILEGPSWEAKQWRQRRSRGWRASRVSVSEHLFGKGDRQ